MSSLTPWWFTLVVGIIALGNGVVAVVISTRSNRNIAETSDMNRADLEQQKFDRDEQRADRDELRIAAGTFLGEARTYIHSVQDRHRLILPPPGQEPYLEVKSETRADFRPVYNAYWQVALISTGPVNQSAKALLEASRAFDYQYMDGPEYPVMTAVTFDDLRKVHVAARGVFYRAVKTILGHERDGPPSAGS